MQFEIKDDAENEDDRDQRSSDENMSQEESERNQSDNEFDNASLSMKQSADKDDAESNTQKNPSHVYEQDKLENVFRAARKGAGRG